MRLNFYTEEELEKIVSRGARVLNIGMTPDGANEIARRARGTPRIAGRLLRRVRDFASAADASSIDRAIADHALSALEVDAAGLDAMDRRYLTTIALNYGGGPVGVETMAAALSEPRDAIEDIIEPFLIQCGYLQRTPRGRLLTSHAFRHLGLAEPARDPSQFGLFGQERGRVTMTGTIEIVAALIRDAAGRVLLVRKRGTTAFMQPGGKRDAGEDDITTLASEIEEELGCGLVARFDPASRRVRCDLGQRARLSGARRAVRDRGDRRDRAEGRDRGDDVGRPGGTCRHRAGAADPRPCAAAGFTETCGR